MGYYTADINKVTRFEVIDKKGRSYVNKDLDDIQLVFQDESRTLKIFLK